MVTKLLYSVLFILSFSLLSFSQNSPRQKYILKHQVLAIKEMTRSGIPASITMAQACLESGDGKSQLARMSNNHFGIKCKSDWKGKKVFYDDDKRNECFRSYNTVKESFIDHTNFLKENFRYSSLFNYKHTDYKSWAKGLKKAGYATANHYDKQLIHIIEQYKLYKLDEKWNEAELENFEPVSLRNSEPKGILLNPYQTKKVEIRNRLKSVVVREGDTFETIAQEFALKDWEIYNFNDYPKGYRPQPNEIIYIQPKKRRTAKNKQNHTIGKDESMHYISQMYGIKLRPLYKRNNMKYGDRPKLGQVIYLRKKKK